MIYVFVRPYSLTTSIIILYLFHSIIYSLFFSSIKDYSQMLIILYFFLPDLQYEESCRFIYSRSVVFLFSINIPHLIMLLFIIKYLFLYIDFYAINYFVFY